MADKIEELQKVVDKIDTEVKEAKDAIQSIIRTQDINNYKNETLVKTLEKVEEKLSLIHTEVLEFKDDLKTEITTTKEGLRKETSIVYVSKDQFSPVKAIVYGLTGLILAAVVSALLAIVIVGG